ncbi:MAG: hypothetical protein N2691_00200 [Patescibacteria group bacterium]|nr:hypothetical protein [Patescibacteria group bacterium]
MADQVRDRDPHALEHSRLVSAFSRVSRAVVYFPLGILALGLLLAWGQYREALENRERERAALVVSPTRKPVPTLLTLQKEASPSVTFSLAGPISCRYETKEATISAAVKNRKIGFRYDTATLSARMVVRDDCLYSWYSNERIGQKQCGIGPLLQMLEFMAALKAVNPTELLSQMQPRISKQKTGTGSELKELMKRCTSDEPDKDAFDIPEAIRFEEVQG